MAIAASTAANQFAPIHLPLFGFTWTKTGAVEMHAESATFSMCAIAFF